MNSIQKFWLGFFTFLPILLVLLLFSYFFTFFITNIEALEHTTHNEVPVEFIQTIGGFILLIVVTAMVSLGIRIYYIVHANNNTNNDINKKVMWTLILVFIGFIGSIIYYFVEIIPAPPKKVTS